MQFHPLLIQGCLLICSVRASVLTLDATNFNSSIANTQIVFVNFYAEWCRFSQILKPIFEQASDAFKVSQGAVLFGSVDCDRQSVIAQRFKVSKYPTMKLFRYGQLVKKEYRGQRSVDALTEFVKTQLQSTVHHVTEHDALDKLLEAKKKHIVGYFGNVQDAEYVNFQKVASVLRDDCQFWVGVGDWARLKNPAGNSVLFKDKDSDAMVDFGGPIAFYEHLLNWTANHCVPLIREITFENAEELTEEGLPFLILFRKPGDKYAEEEFEKAIKAELVDLKSSINVLMADGKKFAHPLYHLGKSEGDLPVVAIDSFRHMFLFPQFSDLNVSGKLRKFVEDLHSGKLHREYHHGPDPDATKSVFNKLKPSDTRYTIVKRDEL